MSFFGIKGVFFSKTTRRICAKFFSGFRRKRLFITTCIEKQCTRPLYYRNPRFILKFKAHIRLTIANIGLNVEYTVYLR